MTTKTRLTEIEKRLSPQEVVLAHLDAAMQRYRSVDEWATAIAAGKVPAVVNVVADAAADAAARAMRGSPRDAVAKAEVEAAKQAIFLVKLLVDVWFQCLRQVETCRLEACLCIREVQVLLLQWPTGGRPAGRTAMRVDRPVEPTAAPSNDQRRAVQQVRRLVESTVARAYLAQGTVEAIQKGYFAGRPVLLADDSRAVEEAVQVAETVAREFNGILPLLSDGGDDASDEADGRIDLAALRVSAAPAVRREAVFLARIAQAEAIKLIGEDDGYRLACAAYRDRFAEGAEAPRLGRE